PAGEPVARPPTPYLKACELGFDRPLAPADRPLERDRPGLEPEAIVFADCLQPAAEVEPPRPGRGIEQLRQRRGELAPLLENAQPRRSRVRVGRVRHAVPKRGTRTLGAGARRTSSRRRRRPERSRPRRTESARADECDPARACGARLVPSGNCCSLVPENTTLWRRFGGSDPNEQPAPLLVAGPREVLRRGAARQQPVPGPRRQLQRGPAEDPNCDRKLDEAPQRQGKIRLRYEIVCRMPIAS